MQRRLTIALVGIALAAVILVGAGVLFLAQLGARESTEVEVQQRVEAVATLIEQANRLTDLGPLGGSGNRFGLTDLDFVVIDAEGAVRRLALDLDGPRRRRPTVVDVVLVRLEPDELDQYRAGETTVLAGPPDDVAVAVRQLELPTVNQPPDGLSVGVIARQEVVTIGDQARAWFLVSTAAVLATAAVAAWLLARRLIRPIKEIERATAAVAAGDFTVRVAADTRDEVGDLGRSVNRMAGDLERSKALDQQFLLSISHDLRTPLTAITGYAEALSDGTMADGAHAGEIIGAHAERLDRLVGDLLDLAKLDANRYALEIGPLDLGVAAGRVVAGLTPEAASRGLTVAFDHDPEARLPVEADPDRLAQVIANVMDNAIKFARHTITVRVRAVDTWDEAGMGRAGSDRPVGQRAVVDVADDGPGIDPRDLPYVFDRLYTGSARPARAENASGMGLAIARELMGAMGGSVRASAAPTGGTRVTIELPLLSPRSGADHTMAVPPDPT